MKTYARLDGPMVAELFATDADLATLFNPALVWVDVTATPAVQVGWVQQSGGGFVAPVAGPVPDGAGVAVVSFANLQAQLSALQAVLTALTNAAGGGGGGD